MKRFGCLISLLLLVFIVGGPIFLMSHALDNHPVVSVQKVPGVDDAAQVKMLGKKVQKALSPSHSNPSLTISQTEFDALGSFLARSSLPVVCELKIHASEAKGAFTLRLPDNPFGNFLNIQASVLPSSQGLKLAHVRIGTLPIPAKPAIFLAQKAADFWLGDKVGSLAVQSIKSVAVTDKFLTVSVSRESVAKLRENMDKVREVLPTVGDPKKVQFYYRKLTKIVTGKPKGRAVSFAEVMSPLFRIAESRSQDSDPIEENRAVIFALALFYGSWRFETFIGPVFTEDLKPSWKRKSPVLLANRLDLRLHFIISAGLKLVSDSGMSFSVGEFKELLDAGRGGSGFSFVDLTADLAGIRFAEAATASPQSARHLQRIMAEGKGEAMFFPDIADLPEGLEQGLFEFWYKDVQSPEYRSLVADIERRINKLPLYKTAPR